MKDENCMSARPFVTVFIPLYNGEHYIGDTIRSVLASTFSDFEIVVADDVSTDGGLSVVRRLADEDSRIRIERHSVNSGTALRLWNDFKSTFRGEFVLYMSQDDLLDPCLLQNLYDRQNETGADIVVPDLMMFYTEKLELDKVVPRSCGLGGRYDVVLSGVEALREKLKGNLPNGFALYRTSIRQTYHFDESVFDDDDYSAYEHLRVADKVVFCKGSFYYRMGNPNAVTKRRSARRYSAFATVERVLALRLDVAPDSFAAAWMKSTKQFIWDYYRFIVDKCAFTKQDQGFVERCFSCSCETRLGLVLRATSLGVRMPIVCLLIGRNLNVILCAVRIVRWTGLFWAMRKIHHLKMPRGK